jgi:lysozyme
MTITPRVVDLYHGDPNPDFAALADAGIVGIIHKATEGSDFVDDAYADRRKAARAVGLQWGAYHFLRPGDMEQQARFFLSIAQPDEHTVLVADHEDSAVSLDELKRFLAAVGEPTVLYSGYLIKEQLGEERDDALAQYRLWLAQYCAPPPEWPVITWPKWWLWQYTESGDIAADLNTYDGSPEELIAEWRAQSTPAPERTVAIAISLPTGVGLQLTLNGTAVTVR